LVEFHNIAKRRKKEEGRRKKEEGRRKKEEGKMLIQLGF
jgi:hypothetical protein